MEQKLQNTSSPHPHPQEQDASRNQQFCWLLKVDFMMMCLFTALDYQRPISCWVNSLIMQQGSNQMVGRWLVCSRFLQKEAENKDYADHLIAIWKYIYCKVQNWSQKASCWVNSKAILMYRKHSWNAKSAWLCTAL